MNKLILLSCLFFLPVIAFSQQVKNVKSVFDGNKVTITYDLTEDKTATTFDVNVKCFDFYDNEVAMFSKTGDIGSGIKAGAKKQIVWKIQNDYRKINSDLYFVVEAIVHEPFEPPPPQNGNYPEMIFIKGGTFSMGSNDGGSDEKPVHSVTLSDFYMGKYEVTVEEFEAFVNATGYKTQDEKDGKGYIYDGSNWKEVEGKNWRHDVSGNTQTDKRHPVIRVSWEDATAYCQWLSKQTGKTYRLPTEAEWEYAAKGGQSFTYAGSNTIGDVAWYWDKAGKKTHQVGTKKANGYGLYDMSGNVWEWCSDWYKGYPGSSGVSDYTGTHRVVRGGSWYSDASFCRVADRVFISPSYGGYLGLRVCREY
ncbi:MAG: formylglycine-generating enzyme family protein [Paludibacteraceae bacterium]|nr:formylglycine-generating enzyme family protein [Paludibacteraceae bacterium]